MVDWQLSDKRAVAITQRHSFNVFVIKIWIYIIGVYGLANQQHNRHYPLMSLIFGHDLD